MLSLLLKGGGGGVTLSSSHSLQIWSPLITCFLVVSIVSSRKKSITYESIEFFTGKRQNQMMQ